MSCNAHGKQVNKWTTLAASLFMVQSAWGQSVTFTGGVYDTSSGSLSGTQSSLTTSGNLGIGSTLSSDGTMSVTNGGSVSSGQSSIGGNDNGTVTVDGSGSSWTTNGGSLGVSNGNGTTGTLNITNGGSVTTGFGLIGNTGTGTGTVNVDGASSSWTASRLYIGYASTGILNITNGGSVSSGVSIIGNSTASPGTVTVDGSGSSWTTNNNPLYVGYESAGTLNITNGGSVSASSVVLAFNQSGYTSTGTLNIETGGVLQTGYVQRRTGSVTMTIDGGTLRATGDQSSFLQGFSAGDITIDSGGATIDTQSFAVGISAPLGGTGGLTKTGTGTLTLTGTNTYTGDTTVSAGTLQLGDGTTNGSVAGNIVNNAALAFNNGSAQTYAGEISGSGSLTKLGAGSLTLTGNNTYTGGTTISAGTLQLGNGTTNGSVAGDIVNNATLAFNNGSAQTYDGAISGSGSLNKLGAGSLTLTGNNTYTGGTAINAGTLALGSSDALGTSGTISFGGGALQYSSSNTTDYSSRFSTAANQQYSIDTNGQDITFATALSSSGGSLNKSGAGTLTLTGNNTYTGGTAINAGTLALGSSGALGTTGTISFSGGSLQYSSSNTTDYSSRFSTAANQQYSIDTNGQNVTFASALSSSGGSLNKSGTGTLTLTGSNTYTGGTTINAGTLQLGNGTTNGSVAGDIVNNAALAFNNGSAQTYDGAISGSGSLTKLGAGSLTLSGTNVYSGGTTINAGTLSLGSSGALGTTGTISFGGGSLQYSSSNTTDYSSRFSTAANQQYSIDTNGQNVTFASALSSSGGSLNKSGTGTLTLTGSNTYTGGTTINAGTLQLGNGTTNGSVAGDIVNNAALAFNNGSAQTYDGAISGSGSLTKLSAGTLTLTGNSTYQGGTTVSDGTLALGSSTALGTGRLDMAQGTTLRFDATGLSLANAMTISGDPTVDVGAGQTDTISGTIADGSQAGVLEKTGTGTLILSGANTYSGGTTINAGTVSISSASNLGTGGVTLDGGTLQNTAALTLANTLTLGASGGTFQTDADMTLSSALSGAGSLTKLGSGTLTISGGNGWSGNTTISAGTLTLDNYTQTSSQTLTIGASGNSTYGRLNVTGAASFNANAKLAVDVASANTLAVGQTFTGVITAGSGLTTANTFNVTDNSALFNFTAVANNGSVNLNVVASTSGYQSVMDNRLFPALNAAAVLDTQIQGSPTGDMAKVVTALGRLSDERSVARAIDQTLPQNSGASATLDTLSAINRLLSSRVSPGGVSTASADAGTGIATGDEAPSKQVWIKSFGSHANQSDQDNASGFSSNSWGMAVGYEGDVGKTRLGVAYAYANTHVNGNTDLSGTGASSKIDTNMLALYGSRPLSGMQGVSLGFQVDAGWNNNRGTRGLNFGGLNRTASANYGALSTHAGLNLSKIIALDASNLFVPSLRMDYTRLQSQSYGESGADALDLNVDSKTTQALVFGVDGRLVHAFNAHSQIEASLGVGFDTINDAGDIVATYAGTPGQSFTTSGMRHAPWTLRAGLGYTYQTGRGSAVSVHYDAEGRTGYLNQSAMIKASWSF